MPDDHGPVEVAYCAHCRQPINLLAPFGYVEDRERGLVWHARPSCRPARLSDSADIDAAAKRVAASLESL